jgi:hypothetical protein
LIGLLEPPRFSQLFSLSRSSIGLARARKPSRPAPRKAAHSTWYSLAGA